VTKPEREKQVAETAPHRRRTDPVSARLALHRTAQAIVVVYVVASLSFFLVRLAPGDPFGSAMDNPNITAEMREQWRRTYGFDRPLHEQYALYLQSLARGDFGWSFSTQRPVAEALRAAIPNTLLLAGTALLLSFAVGIGTAVLQVRRPGYFADRALSKASLLAYSIPEFWLALLLLMVFSLNLGVLPAGGAADPVLHSRMDWTGRMLDTLKHLVLPATTLTVVGAAIVARYQRAALLDVLPSDFIRTARAKGLAEPLVVRRHALRNALLPTITLLGLTIPALLAGSVFVEKIFAWPGMGLLAVNAVAARDYSVVTAVVVVAGTAVAVGSLLADLLYAAADPRLRDG
jgi:peptide/nickel transport system permease protein